MTLMPRTHRDDGSAAISIAIVFPAIALAFLAAAQVVMVAAAHQVALAAAEEGLRVARAHHGTLANGRAAAMGFAHHEPILLAPDVDTSGTTTITVAVHGAAPSVLPGFHLSVAATARAPREVFTTGFPAGRP